MSWNNVTPAWALDDDELIKYGVKIDPKGMEAPLGYSQPLTDWDYETEQPEVDYGSMV